MAFLIKALPYIVSIGGGIAGAMRWLYGEIVKERDRYAKEVDDKEQVIVAKDKELAELTKRVAVLEGDVKSKQMLIDQLENAPDAVTGVSHRKKKKEDKKKHETKHTNN